MKYWIKFTDLKIKRYANDHFSCASSIWYKLKYQTIHISFWCPKFLLLPLSWLIAECATCSNITERYFVFSHKFTNEYFSSKINRTEIFFKKKERKRKLMNDRRGGAVLEQILLSLLWCLRKCSQNKINYSSPLFFLEMYFLR